MRKRWGWAVITCVAVVLAGGCGSSGSGVASTNDVCVEGTTTPDHTRICDFGAYVPNDVAEPAETDAEAAPAEPEATRRERAAEQRRARAERGERRQARQRQRVRQQQRDAAIRAEQQRYMRLDDLAIRLDEALGLAIDVAVDGGDASSARTHLAELQDLIRQANEDALAEGLPSSVGANMLQSAAFNGLAALDNADPSGIVEQRREVVDTRAQLAEDLAG